MQLSEFLKTVSTDDIHGVFAALMCEEHAGYQAYKDSLQRESEMYPLISDVLGSISAEIQNPDGENEETMLRLSGMLFMARAIVMLAEREHLH